MVCFETLAERHDPRKVDVIHRQVEVYQGGRFGEKLGEGDGACRGQLRRGEKETFEGGVERECRSQRLDLERGVGHVRGERQMRARQRVGTYAFECRPRTGISAKIQRLQTQVVFLARPG